MSHSAQNRSTCRIALSAIVNTALAYTPGRTGPAAIGVSLQPAEHHRVELFEEAERLGRCDW